MSEVFLRVRDINGVEELFGCHDPEVMPDGSLIARDRYSRQAAAAWGPGQWISAVPTSLSIPKRRDE